LFAEPVNCSTQNQFCSAKAEPVNHSIALPPSSRQRLNLAVVATPDGKPISTVDSETMRAKQVNYWIRSGLCQSSLLQIKSKLILPVCIL
jgi:hypothetical protein